HRRIAALRARRRRRGIMNAPNTPYRPILTAAARPSTFEVQAVDENGEARATSIAGEHPLTLYVDKHELLTIMTLGAAPEALAIGYLRNQRLLERIDDVVSVQVDWDVNAVVVNTRGGLEDLEAKTAKRTKTTGCGQGAGFMWLDRVEGGDKIFYTTGRLTSEMVIKAAQMEIPFLVSRSGLTQMGYEIAQKVGMTMIGRATGRHYLLFTGAERFGGEAAG